MRETIVRILKHGLPVAVALAAFGWILAEGATIWVASQSARLGSQPTDSPIAGTESFHIRIPLTMAAWGFGIVAGMELLIGLWRVPTPPAPEKPKLNEIQADTDRLLNELLQRAEAEAESRKAAPHEPVPLDRSA